MRMSLFAKGNMNKALFFFGGKHMTTLDEKEILLLQILLDKITPQQMAHIRNILNVDLNYVKGLSTKLNFLPKGG
tara:strand:+ start:240 stop:464 length:225 start_codon:yes stop_codon:yes gene_type:complete